MRIQQDRQAFWGALADRKPAGPEQLEELSHLIDRMDSEAGVRLEFRPEGFFNGLINRADPHLTGEEFRARVVANSGRFPSELWITDQGESAQIGSFSSLRESLVHHGVEELEASADPRAHQNLKIALREGLEFEKSAPHQLLDSLAGSYPRFTYQGESKGVRGSEGLGAFLKEQGASDAVVSRPKLLEEVKTLAQEGFLFENEYEVQPVWTTYAKLVDDDHPFYYDDHLTYNGNTIAQLSETDDVAGMFDTWREQIANLDPKFLTHDSDLPLDRLAAIRQPGVELATHIARYQQLEQHADWNTDAVELYERVGSARSELPIEARLELAEELLKAGNEEIYKGLNTVWERAAEERSPERQRETGEVVASFLANGRQNSEAMMILDMARSLYPEAATETRTEVLKKLAYEGGEGRLSRHLQSLHSLAPSEKHLARLASAYTALCALHEKEERDQIPQRVESLVGLAPDEIVSGLEELGQQVLFTSGAEVAPVDIEMGEDFVDIEGQVLQIKD